MTENTQPEKAERRPRMVKCEVVRKIFIDDPTGKCGHAIPIEPGKLSPEDELENAKRKKAGNTNLLKPEKVIVELSKELANHFSDAGAVKVQA